MFFFRKSKIGFCAFMCTTINLFVKNFHPDPSKTMTSMQLYCDHPCRQLACLIHFVMFTRFHLDSISELEVEHSVECKTSAANTAGSLK